MNTDNNDAGETKQSGCGGLIISFLIIGGISYGAYLAITNYLTTGSVFRSQLTLVMCDEVDKVENNMGLLETYKDGKPYSGYVIMLKNVMENGSFFYDVWEYSEGALLNNGQFISVDSSGEPVQYNPNYLKENISCPFEDVTQTNKKDESEQVIENNTTIEEAEQREKEEEEITSGKEELNQEGLINVSNLNFRSSPKITNNIIGRLDKGDKVIILDKLSGELDENIKGLLTNSISIAIDGVVTKINKGKSLNILNQDGGNIICEVDLGESDLSEIVVSSKDVEILNEEAWVKIQNNETIGYVYARFIDE